MIFKKVVSVVLAFSYCLDDTLPFVKISFRILTENFEDGILQPSGPFEYCPLSKFSSCFCVKRPQGGSISSKPNSASFSKQTLSGSRGLRLYIGLDCARNNTPKFGSCCFLFFPSVMYSFSLSNSDIRCSVCIESFTFAHIHISLDLQILMS